MDGLDFSPRYSYDPRTQTYRLMTPQEKAVAAQQGPLDLGIGGGGGSTGPSGTSSGTGSGGFVGDVGLGLMGIGQAVPGIAGMVASGIGGMMADAAINAQAQTDAAIAQANAQAQEATVSQGLFGPTVSTTTSIAPVAPPGPVSISSIPATDALTAMNAAPPSTSAASSPAATAAAVADSIAAVADAMGIAPGVGPGVAGPGADGAGGGGGGGGGGVDGGGGGGGVDGGVDGGGAPASVGGSSDSSGDGSGGERAGGLIGIKKYQFGGSVMGMGDSSPRYAYAPIMMAKGGIAAAAQQVQNQGRGGDSVLVHMTPSEVKGLDAIARAYGGQVTINPKTGLPEAFFLSAILPALAGGALQAAFPALGAAMGGFAIPAIVGGVTALATKDLGKGLMAGLGAYGGANIAGGLIGAGSVGAEAAAAQGGYGELVKKGFIDQAGNLTSAATQGYNPAMEAAVQAGREQATQEFLKKGTFAQLGESAKQAMNQPVTAAGLGSAIKNVGYATAPMIAASMAGPQPGAGGAGSPTMIRPYTFTRTQRPDAYTPVPGRGPESAERRYFDDVFTPQNPYQVLPYAAGGPVDTLNTRPQMGLPSPEDKRDPDYDYVDLSKVSAMSDGYAMGGLTAFARGGQNLPPRYLQGAGDGMSDSIKANIDGKQEARLADGEFVIPADVVAHLGNGSSNAGAKRLHSMMDRIRQARTGKTRQAPQVRAERFMPA